MKFYPIRNGDLYGVAKKIVRIMKIITIILTVFLLRVSAATQAQISLNEKNTPLLTILSKIKKQTGTDFLYNVYSLKNAKSVSIKCTNASLKEVLDACFANQTLSYKIQDNTVIIAAPPAPVAPQPMPVKAVTLIKITGVVKDTAGITMPNVSVLNKTSGKIVGTDDKGAFAIEANAGEVLVFSFIGYIKQEVTVGTATQLNIVLREEKNLLSTVVVTALGISKDQRKLGYAMTSVKGNLLNEAKEANVANSLTGRVAGLNVSGVSSGPGSSARLLIRGVSNFSSTTGPLFVIDGVPMDNTQKGSPGVYGGQDLGDGISSINPDDIEDVVVLNGSAASALYGTRAANGVIQITTKSGKGQKGFGIEYSGNYSINSIIDNTDYQKVYGQGLNGNRPQTAGDLVTASLNSWGARMDGTMTIGQDGKMHPYAPVANQLGKFYRNAPVFSNTVAMLGANEKGNFRLSLSQTNNQSVIPNSGLKRYSGNLNLSQEIISKLKVTAMINYVHEEVKLRPNLGDMSRNPNFTMGLLPANVSPDYLKVIYDPVTGNENHLGNGGYIPNPWFVVEKVITNSKRDRIISSTSLRYDFTKELYLQTRLGYDHITDNALRIEPTGIGYNANGQLEEQSKAQTTELNLDVLAGYSKKLVANLTLDAAVGGNIRKFNFEKIGLSGSQWKIPYFYTPSNLTILNSIYPSPNRLQTNSAYYTLDFNYKNYLTISNTGRYDKFSTTTKGIFTPSVSGSFIFTNLVTIPNLSFGKVRLAYAKTSGEAQPFKNAKYYSIAAGDIGGKTYANMATEILPENLSPYSMREFETGLELKGLNGRLGLMLSYFARKTANELVSQQISVASGGYLSTYIPLGSTQNRGLELTLNGTAVRSSKFSWDVSFNFTNVNNKLLKIDGVTTQIQNSGEGQYRPTVGPYSNGAGIYGVVGLPLAQIMANDYKYDANGNIIIGVDGIPVRGPFTPMGSGLPKYYGGLNNSFTYKDFNLSFLIDYRFGNKVLSATDFLSVYYGLNKKTLVGRETGIIAKGVTESGQPNQVLVNAQDYYQGLVKNIPAVTVFDGSFIKLRQVTLNYSLPASLISKTPFRSVSIGFAARNLLTLMKHTKNFDPEDTFSSLTGNAGLEGAGLPQTRNYGLSLNVKLK